MPQTISDCLDLARLKGAVATIHAGVAGRKIMVGISRGTDRCCVWQPEETSSDERTSLVAVGCCVKPLTAALVNKAVERGRLSLESPLSQGLPDVPSTLQPLIHGVTLRHLVEHTHGLRAKTVRLPPLTEAGFLDTSALYAHVNQERLAPPGELYSYGHIGGFLCSAVLERLWGEPYEQILERELLSPIGAVLEHIAIPDLQCRWSCGSTGGSMAMRLDALLEWLGLEICRRRQAREGGREAVDEVMALPGWCSVEQGIALGWHAYGNGWFGHSSLMTAMPSFLRFNVERGIAVVVAATGYSPSAIAARLFATAIPDLVPLKIPRLLSKDECAALTLEGYAGEYWGDDARIRIEASAVGGLEFVASAHPQGAQVPLTSKLVPAIERIFFTNGAAARFCSFVQFLRPRAGAYEFIWNGESLWPRRTA